MKEMLRILTVCCRAAVEECSNHFAIDPRLILAYFITASLFIVDRWPFGHIAWLHCGYTV